MINILITGVNSYVGKSLKEWLLSYPDRYRVDCISLRNNEWKERELSCYDVVFHVAGIAHADVGDVSEEKKKQYFQINRDLTIEIAKKAKMQGVRQFIYMSSIIVYSTDSSIFRENIIRRDTVPSPSNFYGKSKLEAEEGIVPLDDGKFAVAVLRPPMIYGRESKGNFSILSKMARKLIVFPKIKNKRSMIYIENLCELVRLIIDNRERGTFFPQNSEYIETAELVRIIAKVHQKKIWITGLVVPIVWIAGFIPGKIAGLINKAFGNLVYDQEMSDYDKGNYRIRSFEESIILTEGKGHKR